MKHYIRDLCFAFLIGWMFNSMTVLLRTESAKAEDKVPQAVICQFELGPVADKVLTEDAIAMGMNDGFDPNNPDTYGEEPDVYPTQ